MKKRWQQYKTEFAFGVGASNFLGELGGANKIGTNDLRDLEILETQFVTNIGARHRFTRNISISADFYWASLSGNDNLTKEYFRNNRNLHFKSKITELDITAEYMIVKERVGGIYRLRGVQRQSFYEKNYFFFGGIGVFHFNPKAFHEGKWHELQPLGTEGQNVSQKNRYKLYQICIPFGIGSRYYWDEHWGVGIKAGVRKTFTDYIDDVSTVYYDNNKIIQTNGYIAGYLADPSKSSRDNDPKNNYVTNAGQQRGDPRDKDSYAFVTVSIHYKIRNAKYKIPIF